MDINELLTSDNIAELLDEDKLKEISAAALAGYEIDEDSRIEWKDKTELAMKIANQTLEKKSHPFPGASNVKYPLVTKSAIDFAARIYREVIPNDRIIHVAVIGQDDQGIKAARAERVSKHMSAQLLRDGGEWEEGIDKLLHILPVVGTVFTKSYYDPILQRNVSEFCHPESIVVNYNVTNLESARRVTHCMSKYVNDIVERIRAGLYREIDVKTLKMSDDNDETDQDPIIEILEQHCFLDLDDDGYAEPYIVTLHEESGEVLRIVARYSEESITLNDKGEVLRIKPDQYFTDYHCIKSPDGGFYSLGLGHLLYPINESINTTLNQLIDAGTYANNVGGFIGRGLRIKTGDIKLKLGQWKVLDAATGVDIRNNIVPIPTKEPSTVLFQLLGFLVETGKDLASLQDTLLGKGPTQNVPATTIMTMVEQGMKVYNSIQKRLYRSLKKEFEKLFRLNHQYLTQAEYTRLLDDPAADVRYDYNLNDYDICPVSDPNVASDVQRIARAKALYEIPTLEPYAKTRYLLQALQVPEAQIQQLAPPPDPNAPPPPEMQKILAEAAKLQADAQSTQQEMQIEVENFRLKQQQFAMQAKEAMARISKMEADAMVNVEKLLTVRDKNAMLAQKEAIQLQFERDKAQADAAIRAAEIGSKLEIAKEKSNDGTGSNN